MDEYLRSFPKIPGAAVTTVLNELELLNFGPRFGLEGGHLTQLPPSRGGKYEVLVPKTDEDELNPVGIRPLEIRVPLGTNVGWNVRATSRREGNLCGLSGSFIPFAATEAERLESGDPRASLEERYTDHQGYVNAVRKAAAELMREGLLLQEDADRFIRTAESGDVLR